MRKKIDRLIFAIARTGLIIVIIASLLSALVAIINVSFNISTRIWFGKNSFISLSGFDRGIPFHARLDTEIPDSSVFRDSAGAKALINFYSQQQASDQPSLKGVDYSDKILSDFKVLNNSSASTGIKLSGAKLKTAVFYLQPQKFWDRVLLSLPEILSLLLIAFCSWQLIRLIAAIHSGSTFSQSSPKRIASIGWAIVCTVLFLFILDFLQTNVVAITFDFSSTIPHYRVPFQATAYKESFAEPGWLIGGAIILLVAKAFSYGNQLQRYEDSTI